jgi:hypothetical protein
MKIYIAGPYSAPTEQGRIDNANRAIDAAIELVKKGHTPFIPHLDHLWDIRAQEQGINYSHAFWLDWCLEWLPLCDAMLFLGHSKGADIELTFARDNHIPIYFSIGEIDYA